MSVMLTATKNVVRKKSANPRAKSACKKKVTKPKAGPQISPSNVKIWQWTELTDGDLGVSSSEKVHTLTFRKDTLEIWVDDLKAKVEDSFAQDAEGALINFDCSIQKGSISTCRNELGELEQVLTLDTPDGPVIVE